MDEKDSDVKRALDDIFGDDIIEIDPAINDEEPIEEIIEINKEELNDEKKESKVEEIKEETITEEKDISLIDNEKQEKSFNKKIFIYFILGFIIGLVFIYFIVNYSSEKEKIVNCSYQAEDTGYKVTDEYKITYKKDNVIYVESIYNYTAKTDEYKNQIEYIKDEKLPIIINSNGMSGFTYTYETSENFFKVFGYLDFTLFDYDKISKINQSVTPISYFNISSKQSFNELTKKLEKEGYVCIKSK